MGIRSHYVPKFYLENFVSYGNKTIWVFHKKTKKLIPQLPKDTAVIKDLYMSSREKKVGKNSLIESIFSDIEGVASVIVNKWLKKPSFLEKDDIESILPFISYLHCRVPREIGITEQVLQVGTEEAIEAIKDKAKNIENVKESYKCFCEAENKERKISFEEFLKMSQDPTLDGKLKIFPSDDYIKGSALEKAMGIAHCLVRMNWYLIVAEKGSYFITNDCPLNVFVYNEKSKKAMFGAGFGLQNVQIHLSLSPSTCLAINYSDSHKTMRANAAYVKEVNRRISHMADDYIFSSHNDSGVVAIMKEFEHTYKYPRVDRQAFRERFKRSFKSKGKKADS